jgi:hypothetical protein
MLYRQFNHVDLKWVIQLPSSAVLTHSANTRVIRIVVRRVYDGAVTLQEMNDDNSFHKPWAVFE